MKKMLFLSLMMLSAVNPALGMEEDGDQQGAPGLGEAALSAIANHLHAGNSHLVRSIAREWYKQNSNGTYREFLDEYTLRPQRRSLPVRLIRAVGLEIMRTRQVDLVRTLRDQAQLAEMISQTSRMLRFLELGFRHIACQFLLSEAAEIDYSGGYIPPHGPQFGHGFDPDTQVEDVLDSMFDGRPSLIDSGLAVVLYKIASAVRNMIGWPFRKFCVITMPFRDSLNISSEMMQRLGAIMQAACHRGFCVLIRLMVRGANDNIWHIIVVHNGVISGVPSIIFPVGSSGAEARRIAQEAIAHAINHQPVFRTIQEAVQYLEELDS